MRESVGAKLSAQITWYGYSRMVYVRDSVEELLVVAGFRDVRHVAFRATASDHQGIVELDQRERESLFVEATR